VPEPREEDVTGQQGERLYDEPTPGGWPPPAAPSGTYARPTPAYPAEPPRGYLAEPRRPVRQRGPKKPRKASDTLASITAVFAVVAAIAITLDSAKQGVPLLAQLATMSMLSRFLIALVILCAFGYLVWRLAETRLFNGERGSCIKLYVKETSRIPVVQRDTTPKVTEYPGGYNPAD
jgi:hypothetical protein